MVPIYRFKFLKIKKNKRLFNADTHFCVYTKHLYFLYLCNVK